MSLINEALKKAQRQRTEPGAGDGDTPGGPIQKRGKPMGAQSLIMLAAAAAVLIVFSVVITVYLVNRRPPQLASSAPPAPKQVIRSDYPDPSPIVVAPLTVPVTENAVPEPVAAAPVPLHPSPTPAEQAPTLPAAAPVDRAPIVRPEPVAPAVANTAPTPVEIPPRPAPAKASAATAAFDPRILSFVDAIKVTGIRSSGNESKVLMNDRVYRVNDIVDRALAIKLVKVEADTLTFTDANGVVYTKNF